MRGGTICTSIIEQLVSRGYVNDYECQCRQMDMKNKIVQNRKQRRMMILSKYYNFSVMTSEGCYIWQVRKELRAG